MRLGLATTWASIAVVSALVWGLSPQAAWAIECENEKGSCTVEVDGNQETGSCKCADCSPEMGWGGGGEDPLPEPTEEQCLESLDMMCQGEPVTDAADVCSPEALDLCEGGLVVFYMTCGGAPTNRVEEICITVACCEHAEEIGIDVLREYWQCVSQYNDCEQAHEACSEGDGGDGSGGGDQGDDGNTGGDGGTGGGDGNGDGDDGLGTGSGSGTDEGAEDGEGSDDKRGCSCSTELERRAAPLALLPLLALGRRPRE